MLSDYEEMKRRTRGFYQTLKIEIPEKDIKSAVKSLTMPQYAEQYKKRKKDDIGDHRALATVGDAVCEAFLMLNRYEDDITPGMLTDAKDELKNTELNKLGEKMLHNVLFAENNDLDSSGEEPNKKAYATAFEAVIGFIALFDKDYHTKHTERILSEYLLTRRKKT